MGKLEDQREILWGLFEDAIAQGRHHETQRMGLTNVTLVAAAATLGFVTLDKKISMSDAPAGAFLVLLGFYGAFFTLKHYERFKMHMAYADSFRAALQMPEVDSLYAKSKKRHADEWNAGWRKLLLRSRLHAWWASFHLLVSALGLVVITLSVA